ncbi:MAG: single-stranded-DNA-specific exonuclease RecJ [bacterium]
MTEWFLKNQPVEAEGIEIRGKKIPKVIIQILKSRGYDTPEKIERYFDPSLSDLHDPFLLGSMEKAVDRVIKAVNNNEKVLVHGDYDADGITGSALVIENLRKFGLDVDSYIPHRIVEGYGLSSNGIRQAIEKGCTLMITVDCGITAVQEVLQAKKSNVDVIICDHHKPQAILPDAYAILDPKLPGDNYPFEELAGVGVAFKLIQGLYTTMKQPVETAYEDLDLVALGSVVDVVPLIDENRVFVKYGLKRITKSKKIGMQAILKETGLKDDLTSYHLGFIIGPRINACGRMRDAKEALELFLTNDQTKATKFAQNLSADNQERRLIEDTIYQEAKFIIQENQLDKDRIIVVGKENWHEGVVGIVASKISEEFYKPAIILSVKQDIAKGSARSIPDLDITETLSVCQDQLIRYGGHNQAAGLELSIEKLVQLRQCINDYALKFDEAIFQRKHSYDMQISLDEITEGVAYFLKFFEPTGMANPQPVFLGTNLEVVGVPRVVGNDHLKFALRDQGKSFEAIAYYQANKILEIEPGKTRLDCLFSIAEDSYTRKKKTVLKIKEMKKSTQK